MVGLFFVIMFLIYILVFHLIVRFKKNNRLKFCELPKMSLKKDGISFVSKSRHRIKIDGFQLVSVGESVYLFNAQKIITISNVDNAETSEGFLYFTALGNVKIYLDLNDISKYFSIIIKSNKFSIEHIKQLAILDIINSNFDEKKSKLLKKYIKIIENILKIHIISKKIEIKQNKYHLQFKLIYKLNNKIHEINVE